MQDALDRLVADWAGQGHVREVVLCVDRNGDRWSACQGQWQGRPVTGQTPFFVASTSKLLATAMLLRLQREGRLRLDDPVLRFFPDGELDGLHRWKGQDLTGKITLRHLMAHRSGLPDYFEGRRRDGSRYARQLLSGQDGAYGWPEVLRWTRDEMRPHFPPGHGRRALYSDSNFYLLGEVIRRVTGGSLHQALHTLVTGPLDLENTGFYRPGLPVMPLRLGARTLDVPLAMASMPVDGGAVSTAEDLMRFTRALFEGHFCDADTLASLQDWRRVFFPLQAGAGLLRFAMPRWLTLGRRYPALLGHSGISGAFAFHCPDRAWTLTGTVNQIEGRGRPYRLMMQALGLLLRSG
jgi:D-alanyl-D-alanine carboxypeptidase